MNFAFSFGIFGRKFEVWAGEMYLAGGEEVQFNEKCFQLCDFGKGISRFGDIPLTGLNRALAGSAITLHRAISRCSGVRIECPVSEEN